MFTYAACYRLTATCDTPGCGASRVYEAWDKKLALRKARRAGWLLVWPSYGKPGRCLCPTCNERKDDPERTNAMTTIRNLGRVACLVLLALSAGGCLTNTGAPMSMASQLHLARQTHTSAMRVANDLIEKQVITSQADKDAVWEASEEVHKGIDEAEVLMGRGDKPGFNYIMGRVQQALDRLARMSVRARQRSGAPTTRTTLWTPSPSRPSFSISASSWRSSQASSRSSPPAPTPLPRTRHS